MSQVITVILIKLKYLVVYTIEELVFKEEKCSLLVNIYLSRSQKVDLVSFYFLSHFYFLFDLFFIFLFLELWVRV